MRTACNLYENCLIIFFFDYIDSLCISVYMINIWNEQWPNKSLQCHIMKVPKGCNEGRKTKETAKTTVRVYA